MTHTVSSTGLDQRGQNVVRAIIASYFIAVGTGLIPGTDLVALMSQFLSAPYAEIAGRALVVFGALIVLTGFWLRGTVLIFGITLFWSSFLENAATDPGALWRDIALTAALILTYVDTQPRAASRRALLRIMPTVRSLISGAPVRPRRVPRLRGPHQAKIMTFRRAEPALPEPIAAVADAPAADADADRGRIATAS